MQYRRASMVEWKSKGRKLMQLSVYGTTVTFVQSNCTGCVNAYGYFIHSGIWNIMFNYNHLHYSKIKNFHKEFDGFIRVLFGLIP